MPEPRPMTPPYRIGPGTGKDSKPAGRGRGFTLTTRLAIAPDGHWATLDPRRLEHLGLSPREAEVLAWVVDGKPNPEIAVPLEVSPRTVQKHLDHIYAKLKVRNRTAVAVLAVRAIAGGTLARAPLPRRGSVFGVRPLHKA